MFAYSCIAQPRGTSAYVHTTVKHGVRGGGRCVPENHFFLDSRVTKTQSQKLKSQLFDPSSHRGAGEGPFWPPWKAR